jgi:hypothetical protein
VIPKRRGGRLLVSTNTKVRLVARQPLRRQWMQSIAQQCWRLNCCARTRKWIEGEICRCPLANRARSAHSTSAAARVRRVALELVLITHRRRPTSGTPPVAPLPTVWRTGAARAAPPQNRPGAAPHTLKNSTHSRLSRLSAGTAPIVLSMPGAQAIDLSTYKGPGKLEADAKSCSIDGDAVALPIAT